MKRKLCTLILGILLLSSFSIAQNEVDALRYSYLTPSGTARYNAMGTSFGGIGADPSVIQFNPAGLGVLRSTEFSITGSLYLTNSSSIYLQNRSSDFATNSKFDHISYVGCIPIKNNQYVKSINIGATYNKINKFNDNIEISADNHVNSFTDWLAARGENIWFDNLIDYDNFYSFLGWESNLIEPINTDSTSYTSIYHGVYGEKQTQNIKRRGTQGEYNFAGAINIKNKIFIGTSIGVQSIYYSERKRLSEVNHKENIPTIHNFNFNEHFETNGSGINVKLGVLVAPKDWLRVGASIHTPTFFTLKDQYQTNIFSSFTIDKYYETSRKSNTGIYDYKLMTPLKANASLGFIIEKQALINIDYEYVDYSMSKLTSIDGYTFMSENNNIKDSYKASHNIKLGMEYRYGPMAFRLGSAYLDSPYKDTHENKNASAMLFSGGFGIRFNKTSIDLSYSYLSSKDKIYYMYSGSGIISPEAKIKNNRNSLFLTLGFKI